MCLPQAVRKPESVLGQGVHAGHEWIVTNNGMAYRCGYVKVEPGHPWHGVDDQDIRDVDVHGGLTFSTADLPCEKGGPDNGWWVGFDCAHSGDDPDPALPGYKEQHFRSEWYSTYKNQSYAEGECRLLCEQAAAAAIPVEKEKQ